MTFIEVSLFEYLSKKSTDPQSETFIEARVYRFSLEIKRHKPAKIGYDYSGTESLWFGNWNNLVCRKIYVLYTPHAMIWNIELSEYITRRDAVIFDIIWSNGYRIRLSLFVTDIISSIVTACPHPVNIILWLNISGIHKNCLYEEFCDVVREITMKW